MDETTNLNEKTFPIGSSTNPRFFYDPDQFAQFQIVRNHLDDIIEEVTALTQRSVSVTNEVIGNFSVWSGDNEFDSLAEKVSEEGGWVKWWNNESPSDPNKTLGFDWTIFGFIYAPGSYIEANGLICPKTMAVLKSLKNVRVAGFSRLNPKTQIKPHTGYTGRRYDSLAFHMGLIIPTDGSCAFQCSNEVHTWKTPGEMIVFDDTFPHAAWNNSDSDIRIVLYIDFIPNPEEWSKFPLL